MRCDGDGFQNDGDFGGVENDDYDDRDASARGTSSRFNARGDLLMHLANISLPQGRLHQAGAV